MASIQWQGIVAGECVQRFEEGHLVYEISLQGLERGDEVDY